MKTAVITTTHHRTAHLRRQRAGIVDSRVPADLHVIVAMDDLVDEPALAAADLPTTMVTCAVENGALPLAHARNLGAATAMDAGADILVFLDVDCIPGPGLIERYRHAAGRPEHMDALLCGPVTYLPPPGPGGYPFGNLHELAQPHPARPAPPDRQIVTGTDHALFWSLSFALTTRTWRRIGGFCELYRGYGAEDTDFAQSAAAQQISLRWIGGADAYHQYHPVSAPPVEHLDDIVRNAAVFHRRWGWWPMEGWLTAFQERGLIRRDDDGRPFISAR